jgi:acetyl-CoA acetyltransferase
MAVIAACEDAQIGPRRLDGFCSYAMDRNGPVRLAAALGTDELRFSAMQWEGGGGGMAAAVGHAAAAIATGQAECVAVIRGLAQGQFGRFGSAPTHEERITGERAHIWPFGCISPGQTYAMRFARWVHDHGGVGLDAQKAISLASYHHAQNNPRAVMYGRPLSSEAYDAARWIVEPWRLFDFCQENDGAAAVILMTPDAARDTAHGPVHVLAAAQGASHRWGAPIHNGPIYATSNFITVAPRLWRMAQLTPQDVDVIESYENFTGGVVMSLVEHGICTAESVDECLRVDNLIAPDGEYPLNTSGGNLAEAYMHGLNLTIEAVRQLRGQSANQVPNARVALVTAGPLTAPVSDLILGTEETL